MSLKSTLLVLFAVLAGRASAQVTTYTSRSTWQAAAGPGVTTIDFTTAARPPLGSYTLYPPPGLTVSGVNFLNLRPGNPIAVTSQNFCCPTYARGYDSVNADSGFQITLPAGTTAVGFDVFTVISGNANGTNRDVLDVMIGTSGPKYPLTTAVAPNNVFFGLVSSTPISTIYIVPEQLNPLPQVDVINFSFRQAPAGPAPTVGAVLNAGDFSMHLAPGVLAAIFGTNFGPGPASSVTATVGGKQAFVVTVTPSQLSVQLPIDAPVGATSLVVTAGGVASASFPITLDATAPAVLSASGTGSGLGLIRTSGNADVTVVAPARAGDNLVAYAIGLGPTNPLIPTGTAPSTANPTASPVTLTVGGVPATITYAGNAPGLVATYQVNFAVPANLQGTQPVVVSISGKNSAPVNLPLFGISAVVSNASFASAGTNAPASIATLFANGLGATDQTTGFPGTTFQGVSVIVNGRSAPLFHLSASANQIDFLMPTELPASGTVNVQLVTPSGTSPNYTLTIAPAVPAFYRIPDPATNGRSNIIAQFANTAWLALPASTATALKLAGNCKLSMANPLAACAEPAAAGDYLVIYTTGLGKTTPNGDPNGTPLATGAIPPADGSVLYKTVATPMVTIGGVPATILYSGLAPGFPGEYQVDIQVPAGVTPGDDVPVTITMPGSTTDTVTISVQPRG